MAADAEKLEGLIYDGKYGAEKIGGFSAACVKCASPDVSIGYVFNCYGGLTGWDQSLWVECRACGERHDLVI